MPKHIIEFTQADFGKVKSIKVKEGDYLIENKSIIGNIECNEVEITVKSPVRGTVSRVFFDSETAISKGDMILEIEIDEKYVPISIDEKSDVVFTQFESAIIEEFLVKEGDVLEKIDTPLLLATFDDISFQIKNKVCGKVTNIQKQVGETIYKNDIIMSFINPNTSINVDSENIKNNEIKNIIFNQTDKAEITELFIREGFILDDQKEAILSASGDGFDFKIKNKDLSGRIIKLYVNIGDIIQKGDVIADVEILPENDIEEFGEDTSLSDLEFARKYGNHTYPEYELSDSLLRELVVRKCSFSVKTSKMGDMVEKIETMIESYGYRCRVYTEDPGTFASIGMLSPGTLGASIGMLSGIGGKVFGAASAAAIAARNLATYNLDYEIGKNFIAKKINVTYKK